MSNVQSALNCAGIDTEQLAKFLKRNIEQSRMIQRLRIEPQTKWLKRELEITYAEKLLSHIKD